MREIKKILMGGFGYIRLGHHTKGRMAKRGYKKGDLVNAIVSGNIIESQFRYSQELGKNTLNYVIAGKDTSNNPIVIVVTEEAKNQFFVITVMPPLDESRFTDCI
ncbi:hypothetical protein COD11_20985 [Bacillus sp. AFS040349]|nr:hypothetical protein COD11_20985 [Bacillus sp. AFS040349]